MPKRREGPARHNRSKHYYFDEIIGFHPNACRVRFSLRTKDPAKAQYLWEQEYKKQWNEYYGIEEKKKPIEATFLDTAEEFVAWERDTKRIKEWQTVENRLNIIAKCWGNPYLRDIKQSAFTLLDEHLQGRKRSKSTVNSYIVLLRAFFSFAIRRGYYEGENPAKEVQFYMTGERRRAYTEAEIAAILKAAKHVEEKASRSAHIQKCAYRLVLLLLYTGMRLGEVLNLRWDNVKEDRIVLKRSETKQKKEKVIPMTNSIREVLESLRDRRRKDGFVIPLRRRSKRVRSSWADSLIRQIRKHSGISDFVFHNLRHTASTIMVSESVGRGVGLADVMRILGHSQIKTTMKYLHHDFDRMKKAAEIMEDHTNKVEKPSQ